MAVTCHECAETKVVIEIIVAIDITEMRAAAFFHENRVRIVGALVAGHAEWNAFQVFFMGLGRLGRATLEGFELLLQFGVHPGLQESQAACAAIRMWPGSLSRPVSG